MYRKMQEPTPELLTGHYVERVPDILILHRLDGSMVGAFSARGGAPVEIAQREPSVERRGGDSLTAVRPRLRANFFGHFEVLCDEEPLPLGRNGKGLTILKYLLANRTRPVSQDHLMGWLWPESNLKNARWSLNSAIHGLRKLLNGYLSAPSSEGYVLLDEGYYRLCSTLKVTTDVDEFEARYQEGLRLEKEGLMGEAADEYEGAIGLYRDDYLVEDLYEDWTMVERERLANAYLDMLGRLALHYFDAGQHQECIEVCYRILDKDRSHEHSYRLLMRCYVRLGLRARALHQYRLCERILDQHYGTAPSPETKHLCEQLVRSESA